MDRFKEYLQQHDGELGNDEPGSNVWQNVKSKMDKSHLQEDIPGHTYIISIHKTPKSWKPVIKIAMKYAVAACIIGLACIGVWHLLNETKTPRQVIPIAKITLYNNKVTPQP